MSSNDPQLSAGMHVTPSIRLVRPLGHGSMGSVWIADHLGLQTQVVVKFMSPEHIDVPATRARFEREGALAAQAKSPHVVQVFDHGMSMQGVPYIAMELLEGEDLGKRLKRDLVIDPIVFTEILTQACKGLSRAHKNRVIHRDIKPANIFLCENDGETLVKILDFGIAKGETGGDFHGTATNAALGTPFYMAPEQIVGSKDVDHRADLWSLGVVAYKAITGTVPFSGDVMGALVMAISMQPHMAPSKRRPSLTPAIDAWMDKALAKRSEERFATAKEMAVAFTEAVTAGLGDSATDDEVRSSLMKLRASVDATTWPSSPNVGPETPMTAFDTAAATTRSAFLKGRASPSVPPPKGRRNALALGALGAVLGLALTASAVTFAVLRPRAGPGAGGSASTTPSSSNVGDPIAPPTASTNDAAASTSQSLTSSTPAASTPAASTPAAPSTSAEPASSAPTSSTRPRVRTKPPKTPKASNPLEMPLQ